MNDHRATTPPPAPRAPVYRGLPRPVRYVAWTLLIVATGTAVGAFAPTVLMRLGAVAALQPGLLAWYAVRSLGFLAYLILAGSVIYGLLLSTKILDAIAHRPVSFALHKDLSIAALLVGGVHGILLLADTSYAFSLRSILVPFQSPYAAVAVGFGQLTFYAVLVVTASFYVRRRIGQQAWRLLHYITFLAFVGASAHGVMSGSDSGSVWAFWLYLIPLVAAVFLLAYRIAVSVSTRTSRPRIERAGVPEVAPSLRGPLDRPPAIG